MLNRTPLKNFLKVPRYRDAYFKRDTVFIFGLMFRLETINSFEASGCVDNYVGLVCFALLCLAAS